MERRYSICYCSSLEKRVDGAEAGLMEEHRNFKKTEVFQGKKINIVVISTF